MFDQDLFLDLFIALFAHLNPLYAIPVFLELTSDYTARQRQRTAAVAALATFIALAVAALIGDQVLQLFGVHMPSFQIAGGLIVLTIALGMLKGESKEDEDAKEVVEQKGAMRNAQSTGPSTAIELFHNRRCRLHASTSSGRTGLL